MYMLKKKDITPELKEEIITYAKVHGIWSVKEKFQVWPETVKYWMDPEYANKIKQKENERHQLTKNDPVKKEKSRVYRESRKISGEGHRVWSQWYEKNKDKRNIVAKKHRLNNLSYYKQKSKENYERHKNLGTYRKKYKEDPLHKLKCNIREALRRALKYGNIEKESPSIKYLGCTIEEFKVYIEQQFKEGMNWDNHGRGETCWHLDHITPLAVLEEGNIDQLQKLCHYTNYQPLWETENLQKQDKLPHDFLKT